MNDTHRSALKLTSVSVPFFSLLFPSFPHWLSPLFPEPHLRRSLPGLPGIPGSRPASRCLAPSPSLGSRLNLPFRLSALFLHSLHFLSFFFFSVFLSLPISAPSSFSFLPPFFPYFSPFLYFLIPPSSPPFLFLSSFFLPSFPPLCFLRASVASAPPLSPQFCSFLLTSVSSPTFPSLLPAPFFDLHLPL